MCVCVCVYLLCCNEKGDCDTDVDCAEGLVCYHRRDTEAVPGCLMPEGKTFFGVDFCVDPPPPTTSPRAPEVPTVAPTDPPVETQPPKTDAPTMDVTFESTRTISPSTIVLGASASTSSPFLETVAPSEADSYAATMSVTDIPSPSPTDVVYPMLEITANNENGMKLRECAGDCDVDDGKA